MPTDTIQTWLSQFSSLLWKHCGDLGSNIILQEETVPFKQLTRFSDSNKEQRGAEIGEGDKLSADKSYN